MVVARAIRPAEPGVEPEPVDTTGIPNNHLQYAITWFSMAALWLGMTGYWLWRNRARSDETGEE
jgi:surfeit locus 1 family protein